MPDTYNSVYFSPTNTTKQVVKIVSDRLSENIKEFDITNQADPMSFGSGDFVIIGIPVYNIAVKWVSNHCGGSLCD